MDGAWVTTALGIWFFWSMLACSMVVTIFKISSNFFIHLLIGIGGIFFVLIMPNYYMNLYMYPFFLAGFIYGKYESKLAWLLDKIKNLCIPLYVIMFFFYKKKHFIYVTGLYNAAYSFEENISIWLFRISIGFVGCVAMIKVIEIMCQFADKFEKRNPSILKIIGYIGRNSMQYYFISLIFVSYYLGPIYNRIKGQLLIKYDSLIRNMGIYDFILTPLIAIIFIFFITALLYVVNNTGIGKFIFGR